MNHKSQTNQSPFRRLINLIRKSWQKTVIITIGFTATIWFLIRVIPKPSRATYPCQQATFPLASGFVIWLISLFALKPFTNKIKSFFPTRIWLGSVVVLLVTSSFGIWTVAFYSKSTNAVNEAKVTKYDFTPGKSNEPIGIAKGIFPGRVVWAHDPKATKWKGN